MCHLLVIYQHVTYYATYFKEVVLICMLLRGWFYPHFMCRES